MPFFGRPDETSVSINQILYERPRRSVLKTKRFFAAYVLKDISIRVVSTLLRILKDGGFPFFEVAFFNKFSFYSLLMVYTLSTPLADSSVRGASKIPGPGGICLLFR